MEFDTIRPIISGIVGGMIALYICSKWAKSLPSVFNGKDQETLLAENKLPIYAVNTIFLLSLFGGVAAYKFGYFADNDWRGLGFFFGLALFVPLVCLTGYGLYKGNDRVSEVLVAYSIDQKMPPKLLISVLIVGSIVFFVSCAKIFI